MKKLTIIFPYYKNAGMLDCQISEWTVYDTGESLEIIVVDDGSPKGFRAEEVFAKWVARKSNNVRLFRILTDLRWNISQARNIGAKMADGEWLLICDIDHLIPAETLVAILAMPLDVTKMYQFERVWNHNDSPHNPHPDTRLIHREAFWRVGGYDEGFAGHYGIIDSDFRRRASGVLSEEVLPLKIRLVGRGEIQDASCPPEMGRKETQETGLMDDIRDWKNRVGKTEPEHFKLPWKEIKL